ncbi:NEDD4-binding protein 2-like 1 isoform X14 [Pan troglodytes]|uniref:NEDD4-binding protein 2-like 1 isoform X14 n=1 Tax=Pan troglodytes TaxID=9598 RepID=UPI003013F0D3
MYSIREKKFSRKKGNFSICSALFSQKISKGFHRYATGGIYPQEMSTYTQECSRYLGIISEQNKDPALVDLMCQRQLQHDFPRALIFSTDDFFFREDGAYEFNPDFLEEAHEWNQKRGISDRTKESFQAGNGHGSFQARNEETFMVSQEKKSTE